MSEHASQKPPGRLSLDDFLRWDDGTDTRYELVDGEVCAMNPRLRGHAGLTARIASALDRQLRPPCQAFSAGGLIIPSIKPRYCIPDIVVSCTRGKASDHWIADPVVVIEVLSPSTGAADRTVKLASYRLLPTVQEILLLRPDEPRAELWRRTPPAWTVLDLIGPDAVAALDAVGATLRLGDLYAGLPEDGSGDGG